jgi:hypothetical protein
MSEASFASLGPTLLARKGGAKPAMRPQLAPLPEVVAAEQLEDLGWNDMGNDTGNDMGNDMGGADEAQASDGAEIVSINSGARRTAANEDHHGESPLVNRQQRPLSERVLADAAMAATIDEEDEAECESDPVEAVRPSPARATALTQPAADKGGRRAAFTLRLDTDRHLKLRLAATMQGTSAQALVTEALDAMLAGIDDLDALAARMKRN